MESTEDHGQQELTELKNLSRRELQHFLNPDSPNSSHLSATSFALPVPYQPAAPAEPHHRRGADPKPAALPTAALPKRVSR